MSLSFSADGTGAGDAPRRGERIGRSPRSRALCGAMAPGARPVFLRGAVQGADGWMVPAHWLAGVAALPGWPYVSIRAAAEVLGMDRATAERLPMVELVPGFWRVALGSVLSGKAKREEAA